MKCVSIAEPWAWLVVHGPKRVENRTWRTSHRGPLLIHTGRRTDMLDRCYANADLNPLLPDRSELPFAAIIGMANLYDCVSREFALRKRPSLDDQRIFIDGPWCWLLRDPIGFRDPIPYSGQRMLFNVPDSVVAHAISAIP